MMIRPMSTGRTPLSPLLMRSSVARVYWPSVWAAIAAGSSAAAASASIVRSGPRSGVTSCASAFFCSRATGAAQPSCGHVSDDCLKVEVGGVVLHHQAPEVKDRDAVGNLEDIGQVVGDHHHRQPAVTQTSDQVQ